jgi:hypothetical protein
MLRLGYSQITTADPRSYNAYSVHFLSSRSLVLLVYIEMFINSRHWMWATQRLP